MAIKRELQPTILSMKQDPKYKRLLHAFQTLALYQVPTQALLDEVETQHKLREIRRLNSGEPGFLDALIKANTNDQAIRGRLTEIIMTCVRANTGLELALDSLRYHFLLTYTDELKSFRTKEERVQIVNMALANFVKYLSRIGMLKESAMLVVSDIDKAAWSIRTSIEALKMHNAPERNL